MLTYQTNQPRGLKTRCFGNRTPNPAPLNSKQLCWLMGQEIQKVSGYVGSGHLLALVRPSEGLGLLDKMAAAVFRPHLPQKEEKNPHSL